MIATEMETVQNVAKESWSGPSGFQRRGARRVGASVLFCVVGMHAAFGRAG